MEIINLDMTPSTVTPNAHAGQYDASRTVRFMLKNGGVPFTLAGTETITAEITRSDNTEVTVNVANTSSNYVDVVFDDTVCTVKGLYACELRLKDSDGFDIGSKNFALLVQRDPYDNAGVVTETASGAIATFETNMADVLQEVRCSINPIQNGTPWIDSNEVNKEPYIKRAVAGTATRIGNHLYDKLVGGTVAFNQHLQYTNAVATRSQFGLNFTRSDNAFEYNIVGTFDYESGDRNAYIYVGSPTIPYIAGHVYLVTNTSEKVRCNLYGITGAGNAYLGQNNLGGTIKKATASGDFSFSLYFGANIENGTEFDETVKLNLFDLTAMFGSTIADYIYSLEQATAGAGVAWFKALFPNDYYAYNAGELMSVKATAHVMKNASNTVIGNYALDSNLELRGLFKLDANNKLYADGDTYESSGAVGRNYVIVDLGSLGWNTAVDGRTTCKFDDVKLVISSATKGNILAVNYLTDTQNNVWNRTNNKTIAITNNPSSTLIIYDADLGNKTNTEVKAALSGIYAVCELATPTTEQASPFTNPQVCDENGTEEYTDSRAVAIPVGHETYQANICPISGFDELNIKQSGQDTSEIAKLIRLEFDDTVYLAEVSCLNGVWKLKLLGAEVDLGDLDYFYANGYYTSDTISEMKSFTVAQTPTIICSNLATKNAYAVYTDGDGIGVDGQKLRVSYTGMPTVKTDFITAVTGWKVVYELATPTEITLDETEQFEALLGVNNVWHDGNGETEVKYLKVGG